MNVPTDEPAGSHPRDSHDHHAGLWSALVQRADAVTAVVGTGQEHLPPRRALLDFLHGDVIAHLQTEDRVLYEAAREVGADGLVAMLEVDHRFLLRLVEQIEEAGSALEAALSTRALVVLFALRMEKEDALVLPMLTEAGVDVTALQEGVIVTMATDYDAQFGYL